MWEDVTKIPFPKQVAELISKIDWNKYEWNITGLPVAEGKYIMGEGKSLYLSELPDGTVKIQRDDSFTGKVFLVGFFQDETNEEGYNYFIDFLVTILNGEVLNVELHKVTEQSVKEFKKSLEDFNAGVKKSIEQHNAWWYKYLYLPWYFAVRGLGYIAICILNFIKTCVFWLVTQATPL